MSVGVQEVAEKALEDTTSQDPASTTNTTKENDTREVVHPAPVVNPDCPDGGLRAWLVVCGTMCSSFSTFGYVNAWGVFQSYYQQNTLKDDTPSNIAWIGSIQYSLVFLPGLISGRMFDLGYFKIPFFIASATLVVATFLVAQCSEYWQFLLCQGVAIGVACGVIYGPTLGLIGHWFQKRRGLALGLTAVGSSVGGTVFPIVARNLITHVGFPWTMRIIGFILIVSLGVSNLTLTRRLPAKNISGGLFNLRAFKSTTFTIYCISGPVTFLGLYTVLTYIDISATFVGISPDFSFYLVSIANASSGFGRYTAGVLTDKLGAINVIAPMCTIAAALTYAWPFARTQGSLVIVAILYGFSSGAYISSFMVPLFVLGDVGDVGRRTGMAMTLSAIGALGGPPISGAINRATGGYEVVGYYAGSMILVAVFFMLLTRYLVLRRFWGKF